MVVPILAGLHAVATADALCCIEQDASRFAVSESTCWNEVAVLLSQSLGGIVGHQRSFPELRSLTIYHFRFPPVNKFTEGNMHLWLNRKRSILWLTPPIDVGSEKK